MSIYSALVSLDREDSVFAVPPPPLPTSTDLLSVTGTCFLPLNVGVHD